MTDLWYIVRQPSKRVSMSAGPWRARSDGSKRSLFRRLSAARAKAGEAGEVWELDFVAQTLRRV